MDEIKNLHITGVNDGFVFGADYDRFPGSTDQPREVCFRREDWNVTPGMIISVEFRDEKGGAEDLPPILADVETIQIISKNVDPNILLEDTDNDPI